MSKQVFILGGCRSAIGSIRGQFEKVTASDLGGAVIGECLRRSSLTPDDVDQVIMGQVLTAGQGQNPARQASLRAQIPYSAPAFTINMLCGSGIKAISLGFQGIRNSDSEIVVAGGQENMTRSEHSAYLRCEKMGAVDLADTLFQDGLTDAFYSVRMGSTVEYVAQRNEISREAQDKFALFSQRKAQAAILNGHFEKEIVPVVDDTGKLIATDESPRSKVTLKALSRLRPVFDQTPKGTVTAGNSAGLNDGAAAVILCSEEEVAKRKLKPLARLVAFAEHGLDPMEMGIAPIGAVQKVLVKAGWSKNEVDLYELSEAFAASSIIVENSLKLDSCKVNVSGGALALGHPLGASGARSLVTLLYGLKRLHLTKGVAALCIGGGMGIAVAVEML